MPPPSWFPRRNGWIRPVSLVRTHPWCCGIGIFLAPVHRFLGGGPGLVGGCSTAQRCAVTKHQVGYSHTERGNICLSTSPSWGRSGLTQGVVGRVLTLPRTEQVKHIPWWTAGKCSSLGDEVSAVSFLPIYARSEGALVLERGLAVAWRPWPSPAGLFPSGLSIHPSILWPGPEPTRRQCTRRPVGPSL